MKYSNFETTKIDNSELSKHIRKAVIFFSIIALITAIPLIAIYTVSRIHQNRVRAQFIYDFDYMIRTLERNFPLFDIIEQRHGVDMLALGKELRDYLANEADDPTYRSFLRLVRNDFLRHARQMGNLELLGYWDIEIELMILNHNWRNLNRIYTFRDILSDTSEHLVLREIAWTREAMIGQWTPSQIFTEIIEEGRIAYLVIGMLPVFNSDIWHDTQYVNAFYNEIADFEHLIIDIRGLEGRNTDYFHRVITAPLIPNSIGLNFHHFFINGEHNQLYFSDLSFTKNNPNEIDFNYMFEEELISSSLISSLKNMDYYFKEQINVAHKWTHRTFNGNIWILIDENTRKGGQLIASFYENLGFATFVGETTGGGFGSPYHWSSNFFVLPNTRFVIRYNPTLMLDSRGRPVELGTEPHFFNRPGLDALQTVLELIQEGAYRHGSE